MLTLIAATTRRSPSRTATASEAAFVIGPLTERLDPCLTMTILYALGAGCLVLTADALHASTLLLLSATFAAGFFVSGGQESVIALATLFYPARAGRARSTGVGWALGIGRLGGIAGPLISDSLFTSQW